MKVSQRAQYKFKLAHGLSDIEAMKRLKILVDTKKREKYPRADVTYTMSVERGSGVLIVNPKYKEVPGVGAAKMKTAERQGISYALPPEEEYWNVNVNFRVEI